MFNVREQAHSIHHNVVDTFNNYMHKVGMQATVKLESELKQEDIDN